MTPRKSDKFQEACHCLETLTPLVKEFYTDVTVSVQVFEVEEARGIVFLKGSRSNGMSIGPFILCENAQTALEQAFKFHLPWVSCVIDQVAWEMEELSSKLGIEVDPLTRTIIDAKRDYEYVIGGWLQERYDRLELDRFMRLGLAKRFYLRELTAPKKVIGAINEDLKDRIDLAWVDNVSNVPVRIFISIDYSVGIPYFWAFTFNETAAQRAKKFIDVDKMKKLATETIPVRNLVGITKENLRKHSEWPNEDLIMINILNAPPASVLKFIWLVVKGAIHESKIQ